MKSEVILYIAASLDGYIADKNGECDYLPWIPEDDYDFGYRQMYDSVGAIIMGNTTYEWIVAHSPAGQWPYADKMCYVYTHHTRQAPDGIEFVNEEPETLLKKLRTTGIGSVWLMGGGNVIRMFLMKGLIDMFDIFYAPVMIGDGVQMFPAGFSQTDLVLEKVETRGGLVELMYRRRHDEQP